MGVPLNLGNLWTETHLSPALDDEVDICVYPLDIWPIPKGGGRYSGFLFAVPPYPGMVRCEGFVLRTRASWRCLLRWWG